MSLSKLRKSKRENDEDKSFRVIKFIYKLLIGSLLFFSVSSYYIKDSRSVLERQKKLDALLSWGLNKKKAFIPVNQVKFQYIPRSGFGYQANIDIPSNQIVCEVPFSLLITPESSNEGSPILNLSIKLLRAKQNNEPFALSLPWYERYPPKEFYNDLEQARLASDEEWEWKDFHSAVFLVISRVHRLSQENELGLVPICDMFNMDERNQHNFNVQCLVYEKQLNTIMQKFSDIVNKEKVFTCETIRPVKAGEELLVAYRDYQGNFVNRQALKTQWGI